MLKGAIGLLSLLFVASSSLGYAQQASTQQASGPRINQADLKALTDARIAVVKAALQLTPDQAKYWPAVEDAMRARAQTRYARIAAIADQLASGREVDPIALFRGRAEALAQRSIELNKIVDAWEPLYRSLAPDQKERMRFVMMVHPLLRAGVDTRRLRAYDEDDDDVSLSNSTRGTVGIAPRQ
jgi:LTXXQ motif family protein